MESITDWAFSWPISGTGGKRVWSVMVCLGGGGEGGGRGEEVTLVVVDDVAQVVAAAVVGFAHAHGVVGEVDIAVVAEDWERAQKLEDARIWRRVLEGREKLTLGHLGGGPVAINRDVPRCGGLRCGTSGSLGIARQAARSN